MAEEEQPDIAWVGIACSAYLALSAQITDVGLSKQLFARDAKWWFSIAKGFFGEAEGAEALEVLMKAQQVKYNNGELSWDEMLDASQQCSTVKLKIESMLE